MVTSILFILLVLIAIAIIWGFLRPLLNGAGETQRSTDCLIVQMHPTKCTYSGFGDSWYVTVQVQRGSEDTNLSGIRLELHNETRSPSALTRDWSQRTIGSSVPRMFESTTAAFALGDFVPSSIASAGLIGANNYVCPLSLPIACTHYQYVPGSGCADFDGSESIDFFDYDAYVKCYEEPNQLLCMNGTQTADVTGDGVITADDYISYVEAYERGDVNCG